MSSDSQEIGQLVRTVLDTEAFGKNKLTGISHREKILHDWGGKQAENFILWSLRVFPIYLCKGRMESANSGSVQKQSESWLC